MHAATRGALLSFDRALDTREYLVIIKDKFVSSIYNICFDPSSEPSRRDGSDEGPQHMISTRRSKKNIPQLL